eukprot:scaffold30108_cov31-Tisochrysis_lutea.AAC.1
MPGMRAEPLAGGLRRLMCGWHSSEHKRGVPDRAEAARALGRAGLCGLLHFPCHRPALSTLARWLAPPAELSEAAPLQARRQGGKRDSDECVRVRPGCWVFVSSTPTRSRVVFIFYYPSLPKA